MKAIVHIGTPKTGTSSLQHFLSMNREALSKQGVLFDPVSLEGRHAEWLILTAEEQGRHVDDLPVRAMYDIPTRADQSLLIAAFEDQLAEGLHGREETTFVISCEMLGWPFRRRPFCAAFHRRISQWFDQVTYVVYLRPQPAWLASAYAQHIRNGGHESLDDFLARNQPPNYARLVENWESVAGPGAVTVRLFDRARLHEGDLIADFCAVLGIDARGMTMPRSVNESLPVGSIRVLRAANGWLIRHIRRPRLKWLLTRLAYRLARSVPGRGAALRLSPEQTAAVTAAVAPSNEVLRKRHFPELATLFPGMMPAASPQPQTQPVA